MIRICLQSDHELREHLINNLRLRILVFVSHVYPHRIAMNNVLKYGQLRLDEDVLRVIKYGMLRVEKDLIRLDEGVIRSA